MIRDVLSGVASLSLDAGLAGLETLANKALEYDPVAQQQLTQLNGKVLLIECTLPSFSFYEVYGEGQIYYHQHWDATPDTSLRGSAMALMLMAMDKENRTSFHGASVEVTGDRNLLRQVRRIMHNLDIDWEAALANLIGDVAAHLVGDSLRTVHKRQREFTDRAAYRAGNFIQEEIRIAPTRVEMESFAQGVDHLAADTERFKRRLNKLIRQVAKKKEN